MRDDELSDIECTGWTCPECGQTTYKAYGFGCEECDFSANPHVSALVEKE